MENDKNSFDYIFPVQLSAFFTYLKMFKCCTKEFHYQVDQSGALGYHMEKSLFSGSFFGICKKGAKNPSEKMPEKNDDLLFPANSISNRSMRMVADSKGDYLKLLKLR
jgi:hypothetical protein